MIKQPIVIVLGAVASKPYGFPTARELLRDIRKSLATEPAFRIRLLGSNYSEAEIGSLHSALMGSPVASVDAFLEIPAHASLARVGKAAIASSPSTSSAALARSTPPDGLCVGTRGSPK